ncbi:hypothetical protein ACWC4J_17455 [Streptomyces sp. NPDC001356]
MRFTSDLSNNVGRRCAIRGEDSGRVWQLRNAMRSKSGALHYLCRHVVTGEFRVVHIDRMSTLY